MSCRLLGVLAKSSKVLEDLPVVGASKDVNLKQKSTRKGNKVKKNQMTKGKQSKSVLQGFGKGNKPLDHISIDEIIKQCPVLADFRHIFTDAEMRRCYERRKDLTKVPEEMYEIDAYDCPEDEIRGYSREDEELDIISKMVIPGSEFEEPFTAIA